MSESFEETESERYQKQLIRINQIGILYLLMGQTYVIEVNNQIKSLIYLLCISLIVVNVLAYTFSASGFNPATWLQEKLLSYR